MHLTMSQGSKLTVPIWPGAMVFTDNAAVAAVFVNDSNVVIQAVAPGTADIFLDMPFWDATSIELEVAATYKAPADPVPPAKK